jgi:hypothetical protein
MDTYRQKLIHKILIRILREVYAVSYFRKMTTKSSFKQSDVTRALRGAKQAGFNAKSVRVEPDGSIEITIAGDIPPPANDQNPWDTAVG